jgi:hypothetical protein
LADQFQAQWNADSSSVLILHNKVRRIVLMMLSECAIISEGAISAAAHERNESSADAICSSVRVSAECLPWYCYPEEFAETQCQNL